MARVYNFSAGPSALPEAVLQRARDELLDWRSTGMSIMEMSHRGKDFVAVAEKSEADLRELLAIPANYKVLFLQGGATGQFAAVPMNLLRGKTKACYVNTGLWSEKAIGEAKLFCSPDIAASSKESGFTIIPSRSDWRIDPDAAYLHYTANETIGGVEFQDIPDSAGLPLVCDMSSNILSRPLDVGRFGLIYAGAQKNMGPAGITVVIVREDLVGQALPGTPSIFDYKKQADNGSMLNTPPTYVWYLLGLVLEWLKEQGGLAAIEARNIRKAEKLYATIDASRYYSNPIEPDCRSRMNVPFRLANADLEKVFLAEARTAGLVNLEGHRSVGGFRASIYNAMPEEGVDALIEFMGEFERKHG
ncbi:3-phosphoserine/phosphohydroxythreonine transaminase [Methylocaldum sp.]|uniref:3-phosphoserine/phosphohydroxythreonine transaminase n=1 Tax=Methylocaldum sp. TaxID=1969727 RepID=UPI002D2B5A84|nr:3-phosphoserine/phosphohydroxythreonine transaminase [Methylocaldum sp.]HYE34530.1 3-phosphoserine/phosphohydroxythreonine transaminase [Methylocaldum sp.]